MRYLLVYKILFFNIFLQFLLVSFSYLLIFDHNCCRTINLNAKVTKPGDRGISKNVANYIRKREFEKLREQGASYEQLKSALINGTLMTKETVGYQKFLGKGNLDQRLRAMITYKRSSNIGIQLTENNANDKELFDAMDSDDSDEVYDDDEEDEDAIYEAFVQNALEQSKLSNLKANMKFDLQSESSLLNNNFENNTNSTVSSLIEDKIRIEIDNNKNESINISEDDLYIPKTSTWGIFPRPRDISKTFGGGRVITREDMNRMDEQGRQYDLDRKTKAKFYLNDAMKYEDENKLLLKDVLSRSRGLMGIGNRQKAVQILENIVNNISSYSDFGSEIWLEYAMSLETVDRIEEARQIYGKLITLYVMILDL